MAKQKKTLKDLKDDAIKPAEAKGKLPGYVNTKQIVTIESKAILTEKEKNEAGQELAHKQKQLDQIIIEKKQRMSAFKDQETEVRSQISELSNKVTLGYEYRKFRCNKDLDFINKIRVYKDVDTGDTIDTRPIEADDYQMRMPL